MLADTLNIGIIGVGGRGLDHLRDLHETTRPPERAARVHAVCDIYGPRKDRARRRAGLETCFHDYREMLEDPSLDGVVIATPDHWHHRMSIDALRAGKAVYCEKPMTLYWEEAREVAREARRAGCVYQVGAQSASEDVWWQARRLIAAGAIGKVLHLQASSNRNVPGGDWNYGIDRDVSLKNLDWERFLGPAPPRPFNAEAVERYFRFRKFWDYSGGLATDLMYHSLSHLLVAVGFQFPLTVAASGGNYVHFDREVPDTFYLSADLESRSTVTLFATAGNDTPVRQEIRGETGTLWVEADTVVIEGQRAYREDARERALAVAGEPNVTVSEDFQTIRVKAQPRLGHMDRFLQSLRDGAPTHLSADEGYRVMTTIGLSVQAFRQGRLARFDPRRQRVA